ncbi:hypothetical protein [Hyalangium versicolor]|uniref:hypothetical protein n=1 Tax=Hyalangium versicolor TaxID=2861190 RepID=UPI001CCCA73B|nr:hypothetical protein [Hyalangium versicolor]
MTEGWSPGRVYELREVLDAQSLGGLRVGDPEERIESLLGAPEGPRARLGRKSKIWARQYGNVSILTEEGRVIAVNMDFEGQREPMVVAGELERWRLPDWEAFARGRGWEVRSISGVSSLRGPGVTIGIDPEGALHTVGLVETRDAP